MDIDLILQKIARQSNKSVEGVRDSNIADIFPHDSKGELPEELYSLDKLCRFVLPELGPHYEFVYEILKSKPNESGWGLFGDTNDLVGQGTVLIRLKLDEDNKLVYRITMQGAEGARNLADAEKQVRFSEGLGAFGLYIGCNSSTIHNVDTSCSCGSYVHSRIVPDWKIGETLERIKEAHNTIEKYYFVKEKEHAR